MPDQKYSVTHQKMGLKSAALAADIEELPHLRSQLDRLNALQALLKELTAEQARLTAARQEVSKQIAEFTDEAQKRLTLVDVAVKQHYGRSSEKLVAYGLQPFRSKPRARRDGPESLPQEQNASGAEAPALPENE